jgi:hypothetical protein
MQRLDLGARADMRITHGPSPAPTMMCWVSGAVEVIPLPQRPFFVFDNQRALARENEEPFLSAVGVVEGVRLAMGDDADVDAEVAEPHLLWLERVQPPPFSWLRTASASARLRTNQPSDVM